MRPRQHEAEPPLHQLRPDAFIIVLISLILQGWTVATAARMFDLDAPPLQQASRLDIDLPGRLGDENTVAGYRVEARCRSRRPRRAFWW
jgi:NhaP-type Na+/H+ and K+/H+ antiporter